MAQITIRNVPDELRDVLKARAARRHQSMQAYILSELELLALLEPDNEWLAEVRADKAADPAYIGTEEILRARDEGRA